MQRETAQITPWIHIWAPNAGRRPGTKADLSGRSENRYDPPRVQGSCGESRVKWIDRLLSIISASINPRWDASLLAASMITKKPDFPPTLQECT
jgi:hypothetical protein